MRKVKLFAGVALGVIAAIAWGMAPANATSAGNGASGESRPATVYHWEDTGRLFFENKLQDCESAGQALVSGTPNIYECIYESDEKYYYSLWLGVAQ